MHLVVTPDRPQDKNQEVYYSSVRLLHCCQMVEAKIHLSSGLNAGPRVLNHFVLP